jgi:multidrug resistance protein MdtO
MAVNAIERHADRRKWLRLLAPNPERLEFTTRLALICSLTTLVTGVYQTPDAALAAYVPFFFNRPARAVSLILNVAFPLIIAVAIALAFLVTNVVLDDALWRVVSIAVISFGFLFLASASRLRPIAGTIAFIIGYILDLLGTIQTGELATRALLYLELCIAIPAGVSFVVNLLLAPAPRRIAEQAISDRLKLCATVLRDAENGARRELAAKVRDGMAPILEQLKLAGIEKSAPVAELGRLRQAALSCFQLMSAVDALASCPEAELSVALREKLADTLEQMARIVQRGEIPEGVTLELPSEASSSPLADGLLTAILDAIARFAEPRATAQTPRKKERGGFLLADAFTNPEHVNYALKTTAAALFCYVLYSLLDWSGIHTCFLTCYIVAQFTAAESVEKLALRIIGCLIGAAAGYAAIVFLVPALTSIGGLMLAVLAGAWVAAYVAAGSPRISYAGFQIAFAFFLCVIQGSGPAFDLTIARDRIIGVLLGNVVAYLTFVYVWPVTISRRVDPALATAFTQLARGASTQVPHERQLLASQAQGTLKGIETDIELAQYEPPSIRRSADWLSARREAVENSQSLGTLLLLGATSIDAATRLEQLASRLAGPSDRRPDPQPPPPASLQTTRPAPMEPGWQTLPAQINQRLRALEEALATGSAGSEATSHANP